MKPEEEKSVSTAALSKQKRNGPVAVLGKIPEDGRKFLDRFKSYFGSKISSQLLNEAHIYQLQPKSATKGFACWSTPEATLFSRSFHLFLDPVSYVQQVTQSVQFQPALGTGNSIFHQYS